MTSFPRATAAKAKEADIGNTSIPSLALLNTNLLSQDLSLDEQLKVTITSVSNSHQMTLMTLLIVSRDIVPTPHVTIQPLITSRATTGNIFFQYRWRQPIVALRRHYLVIGRFSMLRGATKSQAVYLNLAMP